MDVAFHTGYDKVQRKRLLLQKPGAWSRYFLGLTVQIRGDTQTKPSSLGERGEKHLVRAMNNEYPDPLTDFSSHLRIFKCG